MNKDYINLVNFWNKNFDTTNLDKEKLRNELMATNYKDLAPSVKLYDALCMFKGKKKVLDYGAGSGWASIIMAKEGALHIDSVDVANNFKEMVDFYSSAFNVNNKIETSIINENWLKEQYDNTYDGLFCSNVLDVIPIEMALDIIKETSRVVKKDGLVIFSFNYYIDPIKMKEKGFLVVGSNVYIDGVLRLNSLKSEKWTSIFEKYFKDIKLSYFSWPGEAKETRRLFIMKK